MVEDAAIDGGRCGSGPFAVFFQNIEPSVPGCRIACAQS